MNINSARANHLKSACRAPVDTFVRHRVLCYAAATAAAPPTLTRINPQSTTARLHTETDCILVGAAASVYSTHFVRDCLTLRISGPRMLHRSNHKKLACAAPLHTVVRPDSNYNATPLLRFKQRRDFRRLTRPAEHFACPVCSARV